MLGPFESRAGSIAFLAGVVLLCAIGIAAILRWRAGVVAKIRYQELQDSLRSAHMTQSFDKELTKGLREEQWGDYRQEREKRWGDLTRKLGEKGFKQFR